MFLDIVFKNKNVNLEGFEINNFLFYDQTYFLL